MTVEQSIFKRTKVNLSKLKDYGFEKSGGEWLYTQIFMDGDFKAVVRVDVNGDVSGDVYETDGNEIYFPLRIERMSSGFVEKVRNEYQKILENIKDNCFIVNHFVYEQTNRLVHRIFEKYGDEPCFPWDKFDGYGVFKNPGNGKWYAIIMNINASKLDKKFSGEVEIVNLKLHEEKIPYLIKKKGFCPAYHMNKKNWISIILNDSIDDDVLFSLLCESHEFTLKGRIKK